MQRRLVQMSGSYNGGHVSRLEVINQNGRLLTLWPVEVEMYQFQDDGRTLKLFVRTPAEQEQEQP